MQFDRLKRREFVTLLGSAAAWPLAVRAQPAALPVVGWLGATSPEAYASSAEAFRQGLSEAAFVDDRSVKIEYRWADNQYERLPSLAADLVARNVAAIVTSGGSAPALAAKAATTTIPVIFVAGADPIKIGLVPSLSRPGGNVTGITLFSTELNAKKLEILHGLVPPNAVIALLVNPSNPTAATQLQEMQDAANVLGRRSLVLRASNQREIDAAWATLVQEGVGGFVLMPDGFLNGRRDQLVALAARHRIPAIYELREFALAGGLMSYGTNFADAYRQAAIYVARILKGAKPADLPVMQPTKLTLTVNLRTANALGITLPSTLLALADEVIE